MITAFSVTTKLFSVLNWINTQLFLEVLTHWRTCFRWRYHWIIQLFLIHVCPFTKFFDNLLKLGLSVLICLGTRTCCTIWNNRGKKAECTGNWWKETVIILFLSWSQTLRLDLYWAQCLFISVHARWKPKLPALASCSCQQQSECYLKQRSGYPV